MKKRIDGQIFDGERALYNLMDAAVVNCVFAGAADGESAMKESRNISVENCTFELRYPLWHSHGFTLKDSRASGTARAALWYSADGVIDGCTLDGTKLLRECSGIKLTNTVINSAECGWLCRRLDIADCKITSEYFLFQSGDINIDRLEMSGKYSFQYVKNMSVTNSVLDTKDAFWHSTGVTVRNSVINGEYLGWYSDGLTLINCKITGTQPFCYCSNLRLIGCTTEKCDLAFEYSSVEADIIGDIISVKNPKSGRITADAIGEIITSGSVLRESNVEITERGNKNK